MTPAERTELLAQLWAEVLVSLHDAEQADQAPASVTVAPPATREQNPAA